MTCHATRASPERQSLVRYRVLLDSVVESSDQIIATSHDLTPNGSGLEEKSPAISGKSRLVKYYNLARILDFMDFGNILSRSFYDSICSM